MAYLLDTVRLVSGFASARRTCGSPALRQGVGIRRFALAEH